MQLAGLTVVKKKGDNPGTYLPVSCLPAVLQQRAPRVLLPAEVEQWASMVPKASVFTIYLPKHLGERLKPFFVSANAPLPKTLERQAVLLSTELVVTDEDALAALRRLIRVPDVLDGPPSKRQKSCDVAAQADVERAAGTSAGVSVAAVSKDAASASAAPRAAAPSAAATAAPSSAAAPGAAGVVGSSPADASAGTEAAAAVAAVAMLNAIPVLDQGLQAAAGPPGWDAHAGAAPGADPGDGNISAASLMPFFKNGGHGSFGTVAFAIAKHAMGPVQRGATVALKATCLRDAETALATARELQFYRSTRNSLMSCVAPFAGAFMSDAKTAVLVVGKGEGCLMRWAMVNRSSSAQQQAPQQQGTAAGHGSKAQPQAPQPIEGLSVMPMELLQPVARACAQAISAVHQAGFTHLDVKMDNFVLYLVPVADGYDTTWKLIDFGCAQPAGRLEPITSTSSIRPAELVPDGAAQLAAQAWPAVAQHPHLLDAFALGLLVLRVWCGSVRKEAKGGGEWCGNVEVVSKEGRVAEWVPGHIASLLRRTWALDQGACPSIAALLEEEPLLQLPSDVAAAAATPGGRA